MVSLNNWEPVIEALRRDAGHDFSVKQVAPIGGGCINSAYRVDGDGLSYFVKVNRAALGDMFEAEAEGLREMLDTGPVKVPRPVGHGVTREASYLILEWIPLSGSHRGSQRQLGRDLAQMHRKAQPHYGWHRDNTIGSTPQPNRPADDWCVFWGERRLRFQIDLAVKNGAGKGLVAAGERLCSKLPGFFRSYTPQPSLLHGDLWGGNAGADAAGNPVIFDPACYYGDREADIAMTELFGGFGADFYAAYDEVFPLDPGYRVRKALYNLYHILNHYNLFGGGYLSQAKGMIDCLLSEVD